MDFGCQRLSETHAVRGICMIVGTYPHYHPSAITTFRNQKFSKEKRKWHLVHGIMYSLLYIYCCRLHISMIAPTLVYCPTDDEINTKSKNDYHDNYIDIDHDDVNYNKNKNNRNNNNNNNYNYNYNNNNNDDDDNDNNNNIIIIMIIK